MCKTVKMVGLLFALLLAVAIFAILAAPVEAAGVPTKVIAFTDKKVYTAWWNNRAVTPTWKQEDIAPGQTIFLYAFVLDDDGNIMKGRTVQVIFNDTTFDHWEKNDWTRHSDMVGNNTYFTTTINLNDTGTFGDAISSDGLYTTTRVMPSSLLTDVQTSPRVDDHIRVKMTVRDTATGLNTTVYALVSWGRCHQSPDTHAGQHVAAASGSDLCTECHSGYEHFFEGKSNTIPYDNLDVHYKVLGDSLPDSTEDGNGDITSTYWAKFLWNSSVPNGAVADISWKNRSGGGAVFCLFCHKDPAGTNVFDYGAGARTDNPIGSDRPSCSQSTSGYGGLSCHSTTEIEGATVIPWSQGGVVSSANDTLVGINRQKAHNKSGISANVTCTLCHAVPHGLTMPNMSVDISSSGSISDQCQLCHNITGGLNITSNGGTNVPHDGKTQCSNCHIDNNKLDTHLVPVGAFGGRWCLDCHNLTGKSPINMKVDPAIANVSNQNYTHSSLNENSNAANSSRICWACHTNNSYVFNRAVNSTNLSADQHPTGYDTPRNCTACHYNTSAYNFSAPQNSRHTWYAQNMRTAAVTDCTDCHAQDEMLNTWNEAVYPPKNNSEAGSHYGKNRTTFFMGLTSGAYCAYCHQNESTVMGPFANPDNEVRSDHASQVTTPGCGNSTCHKPGRIHDDTLVVPSFSEANISATCQNSTCHPQSNGFNSHNSTLTCWDCHMGNITNTKATWIHPIQFIQYNGNFTGAKLTGATCYDCHKSTSVDNTTLNLSGKKAPKVYNQAHSNDPNNGTKWGDYWKYTPTTYEFASYYVGSGTINTSHPFSNIMVPSNDYMELIENQTGSSNDPVTFPYAKAEREINGPPVPNWTSSTAMSGNTAGSAAAAVQDGTKGNPAGSLKSSFTTGSGSGTIYGYVWWNYSFYYNPDTSQYAYTNASVNYNITVPSANTLPQTAYLRIVKPSGAVATLANSSPITSDTGWLTLSNNSFGSALNENGSVTPYKLQLYTEFQGVKTSKVYTAWYDNILLRFQEKVWNRYEIVINTTGVPVNGSSKLGMSYQAHMENTSLMIYNKTSSAYELLDTLDKGVFFDYVKNINSTHHINSSNGVTGNVSVRFVDTDINDTDAVSDKLHIRYLYVYTDRGLQYPCEQCHSPNKHYLNPSIGSPDRFKGNNKYNTTDLQNSTWCQQCHWQGASNYSGMIKEFNKTRNPPENIPPEITGNTTYAPLAKPGYVNHTGSAYSNMNDSGCFSCHGKSGDTTTSQFVHNVQVGESGNRQCITCHNTSASNTKYKKIDVNALNRSMHAKLKNASANVSNASNPVELACWACHGDGTYNNSDQHHPGIKTCDKCHTNATSGKLTYNAPMVYEHIPPNLATPAADINTTFNGSGWACADCHNNSINTTALINDNEADPINARTGHYGLNRTAGKLIYDYATPPKGNSEDCIYCHKGNSANMTKWGVNTSSTRNLSNKLSPTDHTTKTNNDCGSCHNSNLASIFTFHAVEINAGAGGAGGPNCTNCHDVNGGNPVTGKLVNFSAMNDTNAIHKNLNKDASTTDSGYNRSKSCWACHDEGSQPAQHSSSRYKTPYNCTDCHNTSGSQSGKYPGWNVTEHVKAGTVSGTELFTPLAGNCYACHNKTEMMITAYDPDSGTGAVYGGANGGNNSTSHYGLKRNLGAGDAYCNYCHNNASSPFYLSSVNKSVIEHTTNTTANISNSTTLECADCHSTGKIHNDTLAKPAVQVWTSGKQDYCALCHRAANANATKYVYGHNSSNITAISTDCGYCHNASSQGQISTGKLRIHTSSLTNKSTANTTCTSCHQDAAYVTNQRVVYTHYPGAPSGKANTSQDSFTCEACHGNMAANKMHAPVSIPIDRCNNCHNGTVSGTYKATKLPYVNVTRHDNASHNASNNINCAWCHNNSNAIQKFHFTQYPNGTAQVPGWAGWVNGTNVNCTNCHDTYNQTKPFYAEPIWHKGNYGATPDNCYQCHTNVSSASGSFAPIALHNVTKAIDWSYCNNCHNNNYGGAPVVDNSSLASGMHFNLNGSTPSNTEPACKACHGGNSTLHKNASANNCTYCHITGNTKFGAKNVSRHIPYPYTTDVNTSRYQQVFCSNCHNNSLRTFNDPTPNSSNATTAHYGMNKTANKLMSAANNSKDCVYCHRNNSNMAAWGILAAGNANLSRKGGNHATASNSDCYTCHVNSTTVPLTFHVGDISAGAGGGPDCKACHNIGGNAAGKLVNFSAMNAADAIHKNLNNGASDATGSPENKACWACHTRNGTQPQAGNHTLVDRYRNPYNCTDCHISKTGQNMNFTPKAVLNVTQHKADTVNGTTIFTPLASDCYSCHNKSEMMIAANDPDSGTGAVYGGLHGGDASVSHYGLVSSNIGAGDAYCSYCHSNTTSPFPFVNNHNRSITEHTTNNSANIRNSTTLECVDCHRSGRIHDATLNKTSQTAWTSGQKDFCAPCHKPKPTGQANKSVYLQGHDPANSSGDRIGDCGFCHNASSQGVNGSSLNVHSETLTNSSTALNSSTCQGCHNETVVYTGAAKQILSHLPNGSQYRGNTSTSNYDCKYCHNMTNKPSMHSAGMNRSNGTCDSCHRNNTSPFKSLAKNITQLAGGMVNHSYNGTAKTNCTMCHNASGRVKFHLSKYASGDIADPQDSSGYPTFENRSTWNAADPNNRGILVDCRDCHEKYNDTAPFYAPFQEANRTGVNLQEHVGKGYTLKNCYICHTNETNSVSGEMIVKPAGLHNVGIEPLTGGPNCTKCHNIGATDSGKAPDSMLVNFTAFNSTDSKHRNLTNSTAWGGSSVFGLIDTACWACHQSDGKQMERHPDLMDDTALTGGSKAYRCADCHTVGGIVSSYQPRTYQNATKVYKHYPGSVLSGQKIHSTNYTAGSCQVCHNNSIVFSNISADNSRLNSTVSHYAANTSIGMVQTDLDYSCATCHFDNTTSFGVPKQLGDKGKHSMNRACQGACHNPYYYNGTTINPIILHNASLGIYYDCYKGDCHVKVVRAGRGGNR